MPKNVRFKLEMTIHVEGVCPENELREFEEKVRQMMTVEEDGLTLLVTSLKVLETADA